MMEMSDSLFPLTNSILPTWYMGGGDCLQVAFLGLKAENAKSWGAGDLEEKTQSFRCKSGISVQMFLSLCSSFLRCKRAETENVLQKELNSWRRDPWKSYCQLGASCKRWISAFRNPGDVCFDIFLSWQITFESRIPMGNLSRPFCVSRD